jgi:hypothetical protein
VNSSHGFVHSGASKAAGQVVGFGILYCLVQVVVKLLCLAPVKVCFELGSVRFSECQ